VAASEYTFITYDLRTMARLAELPLSGVSFGDKLNGSETMTGRVNLNASSVQQTDMVAATERGRTGLYIDRAGVPVWDGIVWDRSYDSDSTQLTLSCASTWSYFSHRLNLISANWTGADQWQIFWTHIANVLAVGGTAGGINIGLQSVGITGKARDRQYFSYEKKVLSELIQDLAAVEGGFDFDVALSYVAGTITRTITLYYPRKGRTAAVSGHVLEYGPTTRGNIVKYTWPDLGSAEANIVYNLGAGNGDTMISASAFRGDRISAGWPYLEEVIQNKSTTQLSTLISQAQAEVNARADIQGIPKVTILADADPAFGSWITGDDVRLRISDYRWPRKTDGSPGLDTWRRIIGWKVNVPDDGSAETVDLTLALAQ
jgi:hypothetical protein